MDGVASWLWPGHGPSPAAGSTGSSEVALRQVLNPKAGTDENAGPPEKRSIYRRCWLKEDCQRSKGHSPGLFAFPYKLVSRWIRLDLMGGLTDGSDTATWGFPRNLFFFSGGLKQWIVDLLSCKPALTVFRRPPVIGTLSYPVPCSFSDYRAL